jgi:hypothetical protein
VPILSLALRGSLLLGAVLAMATVGSRTGVPIPDLVLPVVVAAGLLSGPAGGATLGLAAGWMLDLMPPGGAVLGASALVYAAVGLFAGTARREGLASWGWVTAAGLVAALALQGGRTILALGVGLPISWSALGLQVLLGAALASVAVPALVWVEQRLAHVAVR